MRKRLRQGLENLFWICWLDRVVVFVLSYGLSEVMSVSSAPVGENSRGLKNRASFEKTTDMQKGYCSIT